MRSSRNNVLPLLLLIAAAAFPLGAAKAAVIPRCDVLLSAGDSIAAGVAATPSGGVLCVGAGAYSLSASVIVSSPVSIVGFPQQSPLTPDGTAPALMPALTQASGFTLFSIRASNVTIAGLGAVGTGKANSGSPATSCSGPIFASVDAGGVSNPTVSGNRLKDFNCGISFNSAPSNPVANDNYIQGSSYTGVNCVSCAGAPTAWTGNLLFNFGYGTLVGGGFNTYGITFSGPSGAPSHDFTASGNAAYFNPQWQWYDAHGGSHIWYLNNIGVAPGANDGINLVSASSSGGPNPNLDQRANGNVLDLGVTSLIDSVVNCGSAGCGSSTNSSGGEVENNTVRFGTGNGCVIASSPGVTVSGNTCGLAPEQVASITLVNFRDGTADHFLPNQPNRTIADISVNMSAASWPWPQPPGMLAISGVNSCGLRVVGSQLVQALSGSPAACNDFSITATLPGMSGSPFTQGGFSLNGPSEEFVGPFPSWTNVKTSCGAVGNGVADDTAAIQTCLNGLSAATPVVWFPAGTYKISHTLSVYRQSDTTDGAQGMNVIGADPATTTILWAGDSTTPAASFTGSIATTGSGATQVITLTVSGLTGTIVPGQRVDCAGCSPALASPTLIWKQLSGSTYQLATHSGGAVTQASTAMTTTNQAMLWLGGVSYSRINRLTFNGAGNATVAVDQSKPDNFRNYFDTGNEFTDDVFENAARGFDCGGLDYGCAETSMLRDTFSTNTSAGIWMRNANALDMWVWYSRFTNNGFGITNGSGSGGWRIYNSIFSGSASADAAWFNTSLFTMRGNYSSGSNFFWYGGGTSSSNAAILQGNTVLDTTNLTVSNPLANVFGRAGNPSIWEQDPGPLVLVDNIARSVNGATAPIAASYGDLFSIGNTYTAASPESSNLGSIGAHYHAPIAPLVVSRGSINPTPPTLPSTPPNNGRTIYETSPSGSGTTCSSGSPCSVQTAICLASTGSSGFSAGACTGAVIPSKSVVHLLPQTYSITTTLNVPAGADIQIVGDSMMISTLVWGAGGTGPVLQLTGPSKATMRDFHVGGASVANGILVTNADQPNSVSYMQQPFFSNSVTDLLVHQLDYTKVEADDLQDYNIQGNTSVSVIGGASANAGTWLGGATAAFGALVSGDQWTASAGAHVDVADAWNATGVTTPIVELAGKSTFTFSGAFMDNLAAPSVASLTGFQGTAAFVNAFTNNNFSITGDGTGGLVLGLGLVGQSNSFFSDTTSPADTGYFLNGQNAVTGSGVPLTEVPGSPSSPTLISMLDQMRTTAPILRTTLPVGVTDVGIYRVFVSNALTGIDLEH